MTYVAAGRLVADCSYCGRLRIPVSGSLAACHHCRIIQPVTRPADYADAAAVLNARPEPETRNWRPDRGETIDNLMRENAAHGLV